MEQKSKRISSAGKRKKKLIHADLIRRQDIYEKAKEFEERVAEIFQFLGYTTILDYQKDNLQFDIRLEMSGGPLPIHALVECKDTSKPIGQKQIREFASKVEHARRADVKPYQATLVSRSGFLNNAYEVARQQFVHLLTFEQLILSLVDFGPNLEAAIRSFRGTELERLYVEQDAVLQTDLLRGSTNLQPQALTETVLAWLNQPKRTFLALLGDFGAGKTSFCKRLASELAVGIREQPGSARIPVVVDLRSGGSTTVTLENLLTHHFHCLSSKPLNPQSLLYLNREGYLVLLFDGFDEIIAYSEPNRYVENLRQVLRAAEGQAKVILTCRTHYFRDQPEEIRHLGNPSEVLSTEGATRLYEELSKRPGVDIAYLREFTEEQIEEYLEKAVPPPGDWRDLREQIQQTYHLRNLAERPFLLEMIVTTLPKMWTNERSGGRITVADLYETYCESWFNHTDFRLTLTRERKVALVEHLARRIWDAPEQKVHYQTLFEECTSFFCDQPLTPHEKEKIDFEVRTALFLRRDADGYYSFIHRSFLEFFVARTLRAGLLADDLSCLDCRRLTREVAFFLTFWPEADRIPALAKKILEGSYHRRVSENALQILSFYARSLSEPLMGKGTEVSDSSDILRRVLGYFRSLRPPKLYLEGADLAGADLSGACLDNALLTGARLDRARLQGASLAHAQLNGTSLAFANAWKANFEGANLCGASLTYAQCHEANFRGTDLTGADPSFANLSRSVLRTVEPETVELVEAGLPGWLDLSTVEGSGADPTLARQITVFFEESRAELKISRRAWPLELTVASRSEPIPLSFFQERIWFMDQIAPDMSQTLQLTLDIHGKLSVPAFLRSVLEIVRRHDILRTTFHLTDDRPLQNITQEITIKIPLINLLDLPLTVRQRLAHDLILDEAGWLPDLALGPLFKGALLALDEDWHIAIFTIHAIVCDNRSQDLFLRELGLHYMSFSHRNPSPLPELRVQFADVAAWERRCLSDRFTVELTYWQEHLSGAPPILELPTDRPRPSVGPLGDGHSRLLLSEDSATRLHALASHRNATPLMASFAAFNTLLGHYSGSNDLVVGVPVHRRDYQVLEEVIGPFENILALRTDLSGNPTFASLLERVRQGALIAYAHRDLPFERLVAEMQLERSLGHTPLFQVMFAFRRSTSFTCSDQLKITPLEPQSFSTRFDLELMLTEKGPNISAEIVFRGDLFDTSTIDRLLRHFESILNQTTDSPEVCLRDLKLLSPSEWQQITTEWNDTILDLHSVDLCLHEFFEIQARLTPNVMAIFFEDQSLTYSRLDYLATRWATYLINLGVGPEVRVAICIEKSLEMVVGLLAILKAGGAYVPVDPTYPQDRIRFILQDSDASVLLTQKELLNNIPDTQAIVVVLNDKIFEPDPKLQVISSSNTSPENLAYVIYTSGSTGRPKGTMNTHRGIVNRLLSMQRVYKLTPEDRVLQKTSISFDVSVWEIFWPLLTGATLVLPRHNFFKESLYISRLIAQQHITTIHFVPSSLRTFLDEPNINSCSTSLRRILVSGEALDLGVQRQLFERFALSGIERHSLYGPTEAAIDVTACRLTKTTNMAPLGRPVPNTLIYLLNRELQPVPIGVPGQLYIGGIQLARGYIQRSTLTAERFLPDPFSTIPGQRLYATGDLARYSVQGEIEYLGRIDTQVKIRGFRIELGEIEAVLITHENIRDAAVIAREDSPGEKRLVAYVVSTGEPLGISELRDYLQERLPSYLIPASFVFLPTLPLTHSGKIDRRALPAPAAGRPELLTPYVAPRNSFERKLAEIWSNILRMDRIGIRDNFFELGGNSILAALMVARTRNEFRIDLPLREVFQRPAIADLAKLITLLVQDE